jgi:hypothetical protein
LAVVRFAQSYILGRLRHLAFFSLAECQTAVHEALRRINERPMRRLGVSRHALFEAIEHPALQSLPATEYVYAEWRLARVGLDYHVEIESFFYSVPHTLIREQVDVCIAERTIEIFHRGKRVAAHPRRYGGRLHGTDREHFQRWGRSVGPSTEGLIIAILAHRPHPEQGFRTCLGVMRLLRGIRCGPRRTGRLSRRRDRRAQLQEHRLDPRS